MLVASPLLAQNADLTLALYSDPTYNAGQAATLRATVTNLGPDTATAAGVRMTKPSTRFTPPGDCTDVGPEILCNTQALAPGASKTFDVPFTAPDTPGRLTFTAKTEQWTLDPNPSNDSAAAAADVVDKVDLYMSMAVYPSLRAGATSTLSVYVRNRAARRLTSATAFVTVPKELQVVDKRGLCEAIDATNWRCEIANALGRDEGAYFTMDVVPTIRSGDVTFTGHVEPAEPEWNVADNRASLTAKVYDVPDLAVAITTPPSLDAQNQTRTAVTIANDTDVPAIGVSALVRTYPQTIIGGTTADGWTCEQVSQYGVTCRTDRLEPHTTATISVPMQFSAHEARGIVAVDLRMTAGDPTFVMGTRTTQADVIFYRTFRVTTDADDGPGSLRQTIREVNDACNASPCRIEFAGAMTIAPRSELPAIHAADFAINGESQVTLRGEDASNANGLTFDSTTAVIRGLTIEHFGGNALYLHGQPGRTSHQYTIERNILRNNGRRGILGEDVSATIVENTIRDNGDSGMFFTALSPAQVLHNEITRNGRSGVYIGTSYSTVFRDNVIALNRDAGIATGPYGFIEVLENLLAHNGQQGIDLGMDGPTKSTPVITSAHFDASTGETIITGTATGSYGPYTARIYVYANDTSDAEAEQLLGIVITGRNGDWVLRVPRDLGGKSLDASMHLTTDWGDAVSRASTELSPEFFLPASTASPR